jgi:hypothetical protein
MLGLLQEIITSLIKRSGIPRVLAFSLDENGTRSFFSGSGGPYGSLNPRAMKGRSATPLG